MLNVLVTSSTKVLFKGKAKSIILPGEYGIFEVLPYHKCLLSRLLKGIIEVEGREFAIKRGIVKVDRDMVTAIIEE